MSARQNQSASRVARTTTLAGAGVTGLAALFVAGPVATVAAHAAPVPAREGVDPCLVAAKKVAKADAEVTPCYGYQKFRVGVQIKDGSFAPSYADTVGSTVKIVETGPGAENGREEMTCTTQEYTREDTATFCTSVPVKTPNRTRTPQLKVDESPSPFDDESQTYYIAPGDTVTLTQTEATRRLRRDTETAKILPCEVQPDALVARRVNAASGNGYPRCYDEDGYQKRTEVIFEDPGFRSSTTAPDPTTPAPSTSASSSATATTAPPAPPVARNDKAKTTQEVAVDIAIEKNDTANAPLTGVQIVSDPKHGTAELTTAESADPTTGSSAASSSSA